VISIDGNSLQSGLRRRLRLTLVVVLLAAASLWWWREHEARLQAEEIEQFMIALCRDAANGSPDGLRLITDRCTSRFVGEKCWPAMVEALRGQAVWTIDVAGGDRAEDGDGTATHFATVLVNGAPALGLRIIHAGPAGDFTFIGFWREESGAVMPATAP